MSGILGSDKNISSQQHISYDLTKLWATIPLTVHG